MIANKTYVIYVDIYNYEYNVCFMLITIMKILRRLYFDNLDVNAGSQ